LIGAWRDPNTVVRRVAVSALGFSSSPHGTHAVIGALADPKWMVREITAETLARRTGDDAGAPLIAALNDEY
jgi:HEAT repeat protein